MMCILLKGRKVLFTFVVYTADEKIISPLCIYEKKLKVKNFINY